MPQLANIGNADASPAAATGGLHGAASPSLHEQLAETVNILARISATIKDFSISASDHLDYMSTGNTRVSLASLGGDFANMSSQLGPCAESLSVLKRQLEAGENFDHGKEAFRDGACRSSSPSPTISTAATIERVATPTTSVALDDDQDSDATSVVSGDREIHGLGFRVAPDCFAQSYLPVMHCPGYMQSTEGVLGDFELVAPSPSGGLRHLTRHNDRGGLPWSMESEFGRCMDHPVEGLALVETVEGLRWDLVCVVKGSLQHFWRDRTPGAPFSAWKGPRCILPVNSVSGAPSMIKMFTPDGLAALMLFVPSADQRTILHLRTQPVNLSIPGWHPRWRKGQWKWNWRGGSAPAGGDFVITAIAFDKSSPQEWLGNRGVVTINGGTVYRFQLMPKQGLVEVEGRMIMTDPCLVHAPLTGNPVIVDMGILEPGCDETRKTLLLPTMEGGLVHFVSTRGGGWERKGHVVKELGLISGLSALRGPFDLPGNIEVVCRVGDRIYDFAWVCILDRWSRPCVVRPNGDLQ